MLSAMGQSIFSPCFCQIRTLGAYHSSSGRIYCSSKTQTQTPYYSSRSTATVRTSEVNRYGRTPTCFATVATI
jgi:hypothetical protein